MVITGKRMKVVVVEQQKKIANELSDLINKGFGFRCNAMFHSITELMKALDTIEMDVLLLSLELSGKLCFEHISRIRKKYPKLPIIVLTPVLEQETVYNALFAGATGYLQKDISHGKLLSAIQEAFDGGAPLNTYAARKVVSYFHNRDINSLGISRTELTIREKEVMKGLTEGKTLKNIATIMNISVDTVRYHTRNIYKKLQVHSQTEAVVKALRQGLV